jgi:hypothetical protein
VGHVAFDNLMCTGTIMTGLSLFRMSNYPISVATFFEGENTSDGDRLLQVSDMRVKRIIHC